MSESSKRVLIVEAVLRMDDAATYRGLRPAFAIDIVESALIPKIGVGEASFRRLGVSSTLSD